MKNIGRIYGEIIGNEITFASREIFDGDYVRIKEDEQSEKSPELICEVSERSVHNKFFSTPDIIKYINNNMDLQNDTIYTYKIKKIGVIENSELSFKYFNVIPGKNVYDADADSVGLVCGIEKTGEKIGHLKKMPNCPIRLDPNKIFNPHMFIVGRTGSGKSFFTKRFLSDINEIFWVFSPSDEYNDLCDGSEERQLFNDFVLNFDPDKISYYADLNVSEENILRRISFDDKIVYSYKDIVDEICNHYTDSRSQQTFFDDDNYPEIELPAYANSLIKKLKNIRHLKFSKNKELCTIPINSAVFEIGEYTQFEQECIINYYMYDLSFRRVKSKPGDIKKHIIIIEEAHNYIPSTRNTLCKSILVKLSREGRKKGISLCFITQRPRFFDQTALSQSGNKIIFALPNPDDVKHILEDITVYKPELSITIPNQRIGECVIVGDAFNDALEAVIKFD